MNYDQLCDKWAMQATLSDLIGGQDWDSRRWDSTTLAFYNRREFREWLTEQPIEWRDLAPRSMRQN